MADSLRLYNTLTRKKEVFVPVKKGHVGMYSCGPTVYWYQHIGNLRAYMFVDLLKRILFYNKFKVKHIINITDVGHLTSDADEGEDRMEKAMKREGKNPSEIADFYFEAFDDDLRRLNFIEPEKWTKATKHIKEQIDLIKILERKGFTYQTSQAVYFDVSKFKNYGELTGQKLEDKEAGARKDVVTDQEKKNPQDFALWFFTRGHFKDHIQRWNSPWGIGFPGWHIECSAMSMKYLGNKFDIHTGGQDHIPVHHTNEIAQNEGATGRKVVNYWLHNAWLLNKDGSKISKSTGGLYILPELEKLGFEPLAFRYFCLLTHYRKPLTFTLENLKSSQNAYTRLKNIISNLERNKKINKKNIEVAKKQFLKIINDDLNLPKAVAFLWETLRDEKLNDSEKYEIAADVDRVFGLDLVKEKKIEIPEKVKELADEREKARKDKNWKLADEIREKINKSGYIIEDTEGGAKVKKGEQIKTR